MLNSSLITGAVKRHYLKVLENVSARPIKYRFKYGDISGTSRDQTSTVYLDKESGKATSLPHLAALGPLTVK